MALTGVMLGDKHSIRDYGMYFKERPTISPPAPKTVTVDVPGTDGELDLTEAVTGEVKYSNRTITIKLAKKIYYYDQAAFMSQVNNDIHGKRIKLIFDDDDDWYYVGRATVAWSQEYWKLSCTVTVNAEPFKLATTNTTVTMTLTAPGEDVYVPIEETRRNGPPHITELHFGSKADPLLDLTGFTGLALIATGPSWHRTGDQFNKPGWTGLHGVYVKDANGNEYFFDLTDSIGDMVYISTSELATQIDVTSIYVIIIAGHYSYATINAFMVEENATSAEIPVNGPVSIIPSITITCSSPVRFHVGDLTVEYSQSGTYYLENLSLRPGNNLAALGSPNGQSASAVIEYQDKML